MRRGKKRVKDERSRTSGDECHEDFGDTEVISCDKRGSGAGYDDDDGNDSGSAYVFKRTGTSWTQEAKLLPSDGAALDHFGSSVSISGDYAVVGATGDDDNAPDAGSAYLFKRSGTSCT